MSNNAPKSPFAIALAARRQEIEPELLTGAARQLYKDQSLTQAVLEGYAKSAPVVQPKQVVQVHKTFKRG